MKAINKQINISSDKRVYEIAKELQVTSKIIRQKLSEIDITANNHMSFLTKEEIEKLMKYIGKTVNDSYTRIQPERMPNQKKPYKRVYELAKELNTTSTRLKEKLSEIDIKHVNANSVLTEEEISRLYKYIGVTENKDKTKVTTPQKSNLSKSKKFVYFHSPKNKFQQTIDPNVSHRVQMVYNAIESKKKEFGDFKKCELHLHTPASFDYSLHTTFISQNAIDKNGVVTHDGEYRKLSLDSVVELFSNYNIYDEQTIYCIMIRN